MLIQCPHCNMYIEILALNCRIFRCGIFKHNYQQVNPHEIKRLCDLYVFKNLIYGCGRPFTIIGDKAVKCDYI